MAVNCTNLLIEWANVLYNNWPIAFYKLTSASTNQPRLGFLHVSIHYGYVESTTTLGELHFWIKSTSKCLYKGYPSFFKGYTHFSKDYTYFSKGYTYYS